MLEARAVSRGWQVEYNTVRHTAGWAEPPAEVRNSAPPGGARDHPLGGIAPDGDEHGWLKASLDGDNAGRSSAIEIKAPNRDDHKTALCGEVPEKHLAQVNHLLLVSAARGLHYVSYSDYFPRSERLAVVWVPRDEGVLAALFAAEAAFWQVVLEGREPQ
jgi:hypothetical protein